MQHDGEAFESCARVNGGLGQRLKAIGRKFSGLRVAVAFADAVELHEDEVPNLHCRVAGAVDELGTILLRVFGVVAHGVMNFAARAAGACVAHLPEVVLAPETQDALFRRADLFPERDGLFVCGHFLVALEDGEPQARRVKTVLVDEQVPGVADGVFLEVVAEGEVAEHLEEGVVARGLAHFVEVVVFAARADALLGGCGARVGARLLPEEDIFELVHPGVGEQQSRVVGGQKRAGTHACMAVLLEVV